MKYSVPTATELCWKKSLPAFKNNGGYPKSLKKKKKRQNTKMKGFSDFSDMILSSSLTTFFASINFIIIMAADLIVYFGKSHIHMV